MSIDSASAIRSGVVLAGVLGELEELFRVSSESRELREDEAGDMALADLFEHSVSFGVPADHLAGNRAWYYKRYGTFSDARYRKHGPKLQIWPIWGNNDNSFRGRRSVAATAQTGRSGCGASNSPHSPASSSLCPHPIGFLKRFVRPAYPSGNRYCRPVVPG